MKTDIKRAFERTEFILGSEAMDTLKNSHIAVFGIGGVGSYTVEMLVRSAIGEITIIDFADVDITNINRQIQASFNTIGRKKTEVLKERIKAINPELNVNIYDLSFEEETKDKIDFEKFDYIVDAIDTITSKLLLIDIAREKSIPIISSMGFGNKIDPTQIKIADIYDTDIDPLARVMRRELRKRNVEKLKCVYSTEKPININLGDKDQRKAIPASTGFVPPVAGITLASEVVKDLIRGD